MKIYVIEDNPIKAERICSYLEEVFPASTSIFLYGSFQTGLKAIEDASPDIVLLDMNLPTFDRGPNVREGRNRPLGGHDLMRKLRRRNIFPRVVVITQLESFGDGEDEMSFDELTALCEKDFPTMFAGSVYFSSSDNEWQEELLHIIQND